jgi:HD-GYP domain-containing protein (c-di-GMP phosphodiesterase class II)
VTTTGATRATTLQRVAQTLKAAQVHALSNQLLVSSVQQLHELIEGLDGAPLTLLWAADAMFVNSALVTPGPGLTQTLEALTRLFERLGVHELRFDAEVTHEQLLAFIAAFQKHWHSTSPHAIVDEPGPVRFRKLGEDELEAAAVGALDRRQRLLQSYARLAVLAKVVVDHVSRRQRFQLGVVRRAVQRLVEVSIGSEALLAGLTRFPNLQGDLHFHLTATAAFSLLMGRRLGLPRRALVDLALVALLHDLARLELASADLELRKAASLEQPGRSLLAVASLSEARDALLAAAIAFESGLPANGDDSLLRPGAAARLVAVPSLFSRLTTPLPPRKALAADQALRLLRRRAGASLDADTVALFICTVGLFPVGTTVRLSTGELALVLEVPKDPANGARPVVKVFRDAAGGPADAVVDLATDPMRGAVLESVDAAEAANPVPFLLA